MELRNINEGFAQIGEDLIANDPALEYIKNSHATIMFLESNLEKKGNGKIIYGQCEKIPDKYRWAVPCDFTITLFTPNIERMSKDQIKILLLHELLHIRIDVDGFEEKYSINPHDIEDFSLIIQRYGIDWSE